MLAKHQWCSQCFRTRTLTHRLVEAEVLLMGCCSVVEQAAAHLGAQMQAHEAE
jgi:hypothetical protein